ncbi:IclR family transcriptional regulator [Streptomyces sp. Li-HN-5-11]|uniref:IclR family transcriptional regulator n=1 Tax=Streptomyces sp. Li-HN-5-11 TaxID=3075432 RepID=UPI0028AEEE21|nr:IclR family transcriptional regulator [Streptomyces sp. Li-HN-5-11]WNM31942.1 IclR family transcriptional regulator [Streptomyces sp. Li-HN-5-11]
MTATRDDRAAIDKAVSLLLSFGDEASTGLGVSELSRRAGLSKSTTFRVLGVLVRNGVVEKEGSRYRLGSRLYDLGTQVYSAAHMQICEILTPFGADLLEMTRQTVHLAALRGTDVVYLGKLYGHHPIASPSRIGGLVPAHGTAVGKVLLAFDSAAFDAVTDQELPALTPRTITDPLLLASQLMRVRQTGVAYDDQEAAPDLTCVAAPVFGVNGRVVAAISVSGRVGTFEPRSHAAVLRKVVQAASQALHRAGIGSTSGQTRNALAS